MVKYSFDKLLSVAVKHLTILSISLLKRFTVGFNAKIKNDENCVWQNILMIELFTILWAAVHWQHLWITCQKGPNPRWRQGRRVSGTGMKANMENFIPNKLKKMEKQQFEETQRSLLADKRELHFLEKEKGSGNVCQARWPPNLWIPGGHSSLYTAPPPTQVRDF